MRCLGFCAHHTGWLTFTADTDLLMTELTPAVCTLTKFRTATLYFPQAPSCNGGYIHAEPKNDPQIINQQF